MSARKKTAKLPPIHPGEHLRDELQERGISMNKLSRDARIPMSRISAIVNGQRSISAETALRLEKYLGISARSWMDLQSQYELQLAEDQFAETIAREVIAAA